MTSTLSRPGERPDPQAGGRTLPAFVLQGARSRAAKPALIDGPTGRTITYGHLAAGVPRVAGSLAARGLAHGDVLAMFTPNLPEYPLAVHGALAAGAVVSTVNPSSTPEELARHLSDAQARYLVTVGPLLDQAQLAAERAGVEEVFVLGEAAGGTPFAALLGDDVAQVGPAVDPDHDVAALLYSSGTSGLPKGVELTHRNLVANVGQNIAALAYRSDDVLMGALPFFHVAGFTCVLNAGLRAGATIVSLPRFDLEGFLQVIQDHRVTVAIVVPPIVLALAKHPAVDRYDLSSLRLLGSGAAPLGGELEQQCADRLGCEVMQGFGMTELSGLATVSRPGAARRGSSGLPLPDTEVRVVDPETGTVLEAGRTGELWVRGPQVMRGYRGHPEATAETLDGDGWLHTGDLGYLDEDGYLFVVDRLKELIKYKGFQVAPAELEALLLTHPAVADAAVIPRADEQAGEIPVAYLVLSGAVTPEALIEFVAARVSPHKRIRAVEFIEAIPKSPSGKILRRLLVAGDRARCS